MSESRREDMKRIAMCASIMVMLACALPAHAGGVSGSVLVATGHPSAARGAYDMNPRSNGLVGWVFRLQAPVEGGRYELRTTRGLTGAENFDAYFYEDSRDGSGPGDPCMPGPIDERIHSESGVICPGPQVAAWGIVVLVTGAEGRFELTY